MSKEHLKYTMGPNQARMWMQDFERDKFEFAQNDIIQATMNQASANMRRAHWVNTDNKVHSLTFECLNHWLKDLGFQVEVKLNENGHAYISWSW